MATSSLASLVKQLERNVAKFSADMRKAARISRRMMASIEKSSAAAKIALGNIQSIRVAVSVGAAVQSIRGAINIGDEIKRMADTTAQAIDKLDSMKVARRGK